MLLLDESVRIDNIEEDIKDMKSQIRANSGDISSLKEDFRETKVYTKMILEKIDYLTVGFENMRRDREKDKEQQIKELKECEKDDTSFKHKIKLVDRKELWAGIFLTIGIVLPYIMNYIFR